MSRTPQSTKNAAHVIRAGAQAAGYKAIMSFFAAKDRGGYHAGRAEIYGRGGKGDKDYSIRQARDKNALTDAGSAMDVTMRGPEQRKHQRELTAYLVAEQAAGRADILAEVIGPGPDGRAYEWGFYNGWKGKLRPVGDSHEWHTHIGFRRDTENGDRASMFAGFFGASNGGGAVAPTPFPASDLRPRSRWANLRAWPGLAAPVIRRVVAGGRIATGRGRIGSWVRESDGGHSALWFEVLAVNGKPLDRPLWVSSLAVKAAPPSNG